jgi:sigma-B regulation protein RsbU (phosphoserine phosphatase)
MGSRLKKLLLQLGSLSWIDKACLVILVARLVLPLSAWVQLIFTIAIIVFLIRWSPWLIRKLLWRVRHRLIVTWILAGVVPIILIFALAAQGLFVLMGQVVSYMTTAEIGRRSELVYSDANALAWSLSHRAPSTTITMLAEVFVRELSQKRGAAVGTIVRQGGDLYSLPQDAAIPAIPQWSKAEYKGVVKGDDSYYFCAHVAVQGVEVFLYEYASRESLKDLLPKVAAVVMDMGSVTAGGIDIRTSNKQSSGFSFKTTKDEDTDLGPLIRASTPPARAWWDRPVNWLVVIPTNDLATGKVDESVAVVASRYSLVLKELFNRRGSAIFAFILMIVIACVFLIIEVVSLLFGVKLTRSITRAVADLYQGTRKIQSGDFLHRIPVRKTKDQLSELAGSFNTMTERIQQLIVEVKEKERLENELEIARDVQSRLFPKEFPRLKTLELWGGCDPARTVSGDYYDFVSISPDRAALAIGDISGKGISAALLMAHIQSALRSQLMHRNGQPQPAVISVSSTSSILSVLNDHLYTSSPPEKYATFFLGLYDDEIGQLIYTNAGHLAPMLVRRNQVLRLPGEGFPVGLFPGVQFDQQEIRLEPGDLLVGFTDGVTETPNAKGDEFGDHRLTDLLLRHSEKELDRIAAEIRDSVAAWTGDLERHDDTTLVLARRL